MPKVVLKSEKEATDFSPVPPGDYVCKLEKIEEKTSKAGNDLWSMKFEITEKGEYEHRFIFDQLVFSENTLNRVKLIAKRLAGFSDEELNNEDGVELLPEDFEGKFCILTVEIDTYTDSNDQEKEKNKVTFGGYKEYVVTGESDEIPF